MLFFPNAKINIGLHITGKRSDGYHNIETVFCPVGLSDILEFVPLSGESSGYIGYSASGIKVDGSWESNLCVKAYNLLSAQYKLPALAIHLHKIIPLGAGLGGGSSDAAFMLIHLNRQFDLQLDEASLCNFASQLGSDCAFFIKNRPLFAYERGNQFKETALPENLKVVIIHPGIHVSTAEAYAGVKPGPPEQALEKLITLPVTEWKSKIVNDFEASIVKKHPVIGTIKYKLYESGAVYASMSGSGSSVYGLFMEKAPDLSNHFPDCFCWAGPIQTQSSMYP